MRTKLIVILFIIAIASIIFNWYLLSSKEIRIKEILRERNQTELQSKCYVDLQPSSFFSKEPIPSIIINQNEPSIKLMLNSKDALGYWIKTIDTIQVRGQSMNPAIGDNSLLIVVTPKSKDDLKVGDIISIRSGKCKDVLHRIIKIDGEEYITKGDNNPVDDKVAFDCNNRFEDVEYKVVGVLY